MSKQDRIRLKLALALSETKRPNGYQAPSAPRRFLREEVRASR